MNDDDKKEKKQENKALGNRNEMPETPDFAEWGITPRKGSPFALNDWSAGSPANTTKP